MVARIYIVIPALWKAEERGFQIQTQPEQVGSERPHLKTKAENVAPHIFNPSYKRKKKRKAINQSLAPGLINIQS